MNDHSGRICKPTMYRMDLSRFEAAAEKFLPKIKYMPKVQAVPLVDDEAANDFAHADAVVGVKIWYKDCWKFNLNLQYWYRANKVDMTFKNVDTALDHLRSTMWDDELMMQAIRVIATIAENHDALVKALPRIFNKKLYDLNRRSKARRKQDRRMSLYPTRKA